MADVQALIESGLTGHYTLERELGRGGMATVFLAHDLKHDRPVALKVLHPALAASLGPDRFQREIHIAARLQHPHILPVYDSGDTAGQLWFTMPYVDGETLRSRLRREGQLPLDVALRIAREAAQALHYAHEHHVIHRDIKPENLLLTSDGNTLVADFGIARAMGGDDERLTETGLSIGTPAYMSPEQASGDRGLDARTDIYSLATVLYEMLAGEPPYTGPTAQAIITKRISDPVPSVRRLRPGVPPEIDHAVARGLALVPADRFATAAQFAQALTPSGATPTATWTAVLPRGQRRRLPVALATLGIGFVLGLGVLFAWRRTHRGGEVGGPKHLAVLPFENQGDSADAYLADGITDELRGKLAALPGLEVIASRSSNDYRRTNKSLPEIARDLGVDYLLVGKIRWEKAAAGPGRVQVRPELIKVTPGNAPTTKWEEPFEASLTDVFQVQADIAGRVAQSLDVALGSGGPEGSVARPTTSTEAYDDYLRANEYYDRSTAPDARIAIQLYQRALGLDSSFTQAWARLARAEAFLYWFHADHSAEQLARIEQAARRAIALGPQLPESHVAMGYYYYWGHREYAQALDQFTLALQGAPNDAEVAEATGLILRRQGKFEQALTSLKRAAALDPRSYSDMVEVGDTYLWMRAFPEAERELNRAVAIAPDLPFARSFLALLYLNWQGSLEVPRRILREGLSRIDLGRLTGILPDPFSLIAADDPFQPEVSRLTPSSFNGDTLTYFVFKANVYRYRGERNQAGAYDDSTRSEALAVIARHEDDALTEAHLAVADAYLGRSNEAIAAGERAEAITPLSQDALAGQFGVWALARVYAVLGNTSAALDHLEPLLAMPSFLSAGQLRIDPAWAPLRGNPRFQRLLAGK